MNVILKILVLASLASCSESKFASSSSGKGKTEPKDSVAPEESEETKTKKKKNSQNNDIVTEVESVDGEEEEEEEEEETEDEVEDEISIEETQAYSCILDATGQNVQQIAIHGENCINNGVDRDGADFDDYHVTISGELLRAGWELFSTKDQNITIIYNLGTPGTTKQNVNMQIVDCNRKESDNFTVSTGNGNRVFAAKKGDRFNIITTITSGCYGRKDVYDLITDQTKAFRISP